MKKSPMIIFLYCCICKVTTIIVITLTVNLFYFFYLFFYRSQIKHMESVGPQNWLFKEQVLVSFYLPFLRVSLKTDAKNGLESVALPQQRPPVLI